MNLKIMPLLITTDSYCLNQASFSGENIFLLDIAIRVPLFISYEIDSMRGFYFTRVIYILKEERVVCHHTSISSMKDRGRMRMIP